MSKSLTEQKVLKKLNIKDFRHLTKDKVVSMATMLDKMDPEVAKKAIEQFPDFSNAVKEIFAEYKTILDKAIESNDKSESSLFDTCDAIITACQKELDKDILTFDEKKYILEKMADIAKIKFEKDSEGKKYRILISVLGFSTVSLLIGAMASALGGRMDFDSIKSLDD